MASYNYSTTKAYSAGSDETVSNVWTFHATTNITISTSSLYTLPWTAANVGESITGCMPYVIAVGTGGNVTFQLQGNSAGYVDIAGVAVTVATTDLKAGGYNYFQLATPYAVTSGAANYYRWRVVNAGATGTTTFAANSAGTAIGFKTLDDRSAVPTNADSVTIAPPILGSCVVTNTGSQTAGGANTGATSTEIASIRPSGSDHALDICYGGTFIYDNTANSTFTSKGNVVVRNGGAYKQSADGSGLSSSYVATLIFDENGTSGNYGFIEADGSTVEGWGMDKTGKKSSNITFTSGVGTAADPAIVSADIGEVGDEVEFGAVSDNATNYNEAEKRYIKTKNSATSYVLSSTLGGAESALTYTHAGATVVNLDANVKITSSSSSYGWFYQNYNTTKANTTWKNVQCEYVGSTAAYKQAFFVNNITNTDAVMDCVKIVRRIGNGFGFRGSNVPRTYNDLILCGGISTNTVPGYDFDGSANITLTNSLAIDEKRVALSTGNSGSANVVFDNFELNACGKDGGVTGTAYLVGGIYGWTFYNSKFNACRQQAIYLNNVTTQFFNCDIGTKGTNGTAISVAGLNTALFYNCNISPSDTLISGYTSQYTGSVVAFHNLNNDATGMNHSWYTPFGSAHACMTGLDDTTETASGHPTVGIYPEDSTYGFTWSFQVPVFQYYSGSILASLKRNATFASGDVIVEIYLPGSTTADDTYTMSTTTETWETATAAKTYSGSVDGLATIKITAKTTTSGAYLYVGNIFGGTNQVTNLNVWYNGMPSSLMFDQIGNPLAMWAQQDSTFTIAGSAGADLVKILKNTKDIIPY
jgi:hypothetical protein